MNKLFHFLRRNHTQPFNSRASDTARRWFETLKVTTATMCMKQFIATAWRRHEFKIVCLFAYTVFFLLVIALAISLLLVSG